MASRRWHCHHRKNTLCASRLFKSICTSHACLCGCCKRCCQYARSYPILERAASVCTHVAPPLPPCGSALLCDVLALAKRMPYSPMKAAVSTGLSVALGLSTGICATLRYSRTVLFEVRGKVTSARKPPRPEAGLSAVADISSRRYLELNEYRYLQENRYAHSVRVLINVMPHTGMRVRLQRRILAMSWVMGHAVVSFLFEWLSGLCYGENECKEEWGVGKPTRGGFSKTVWSNVPF